MSPLEWFGVPVLLPILLQRYEDVLDGVLVDYLGDEPVALCGEVGAVVGELPP